MTATQDAWWQRGVIYQIYPRSFQDSNADGVGDLQGIIQRLGYLQHLGVDAIWISPIFPSPMVDFGYDVADYCDIDPLFGSLADFDQLVAAAHHHQLKVVLDLVPNHTSDQHRWFRESRRSRDNPQRDWYIWRDPAPDGGPPNNWLAVFGGSAWEFDSATGQYYLHLYHRTQPDLNWRNPEVRQAMAEVLRFWLRRGVDGFRVDVIWQMIKDAQFRDNPPNPNWKPGDFAPWRLLDRYTSDQPEVHQVIAELRQVIDEFPERVLIGEMYLPVERMMDYYGTPEQPECHLPFNFQLITQPWQVHGLRRIITAYDAAIPAYGWPNYVLGNHDQRRIASRVGPDQARLAAMLLLTLRGTPTLYYGDELGMTDVPIPPALMKDPQAEVDPKASRDPARTPMLWDATVGAGFSQVAPWLPLSENLAEIHLARQQQQPDSIWQLYYRLLQLRRQETALSLGAYQTVPTELPVLAYWRRAGQRELLIVLNFSDQVMTWTLPCPMRAMLSTTHDRDSEEGQQLLLRGYEGVILEHL